LRARRRAEGGARGRRVRRGPSRRRLADRRCRRHQGDRADAGRGGRATGSRVPQRRAGSGLRAVQPAWVRREHAAVGIVHDHRDARAGDRGAHGHRAGRRRERLVNWVDWLLLVARVVIVFFALLIAVMLYIWMERKVIADVQTRVGPLRAGPRGVLVTLADGIKLFFKEGISPTSADRLVYGIAPV